MNIYELIMSSDLITSKLESKNIGSYEKRQI